MNNDDDKVNSAGDKIGPGDKIRADWRKEKNFRAHIRVEGMLPDDSGISSTIGSSMAIPRRLYRTPNSGSAEIDPTNN